MSTTVLAVALLFVFVVAGTSHAAAEEPDPRLTRGFDLACNLDHRDAIASLESAIAERPDDPAVHRGVASVTWLRILFLRGAVLVDNYLTGSISRPGGKVEKPPEDLDEVFQTHLARAIELSEEAVRLRPEDPSAHYELGASVALVASYKASIQGQPLRALRDAKRAYTAH